jgi:hypothetical protein
MLTALCNEPIDEYLAILFATAALGRRSREIAFAE